MKVIVIKKNMNVENEPETQEEEITNACPEEIVDSAVEFVKNLRRDSNGNITEETIENTVHVNKAHAIRTLIMDMMALNPIITKDENDIPEEEYNKYVEIGKKIDRCFDTLMEEYIDRHEEDACECECDMTCDHNCEDCHEHALCGKCSLECDIDCGECEHCVECSDNSFNDEYDSCDNDEHCHDCTCEGDCDECERDIVEDDCDCICDYSINARFGNLAADMATLVEIMKEAFSDDTITDGETIDIKEISGKEYNTIKSIFDKYDVVKSLRVKE